MVRRPIHSPPYRPLGRVWKGERENVGVIGCGGTSNIASHSAYSLGTFGLGKRMLKSSLPLLVT